MKQRKMVAALILCLVTMMMTCTMVLADVIWEPDDSFYKKHADSSEYEGRSYIANGEKGYITVYKDPKSKEVMGYSENGTIFYVSFVYPRYASQNERWGIIEYQVEKKGIVVKPDGTKKTRTGWVKLEEMMVQYDHNAFYSDHKEELETYSGGFNPSSYHDKILFWTYPGSGVIRNRFDMSTIQDTDLNFSYVYTDAEGLEWGYVGYFYASSGWICLSDPTNDNLPVTAPNQEIIQPSLPTSIKIPGEGLGEGETSLTIIIIALVAGLVVITAVLIRVFWKKKPALPNGNEAEKDT